MFEEKQIWEKKKEKQVYTSGLAKVQDKTLDIWNRTTRDTSNRTTSTHIIIAPFVVLIFGLYVDGKLRQEGALEGKRRDNEKSIGNAITVIW